MYHSSTCSYQLSERRNSEIRFNWQRICLAVGKTDIVPHVVAFLQEQVMLRDVGRLVVRHTCICPLFLVFGKFAP